MGDRRIVAWWGGDPWRSIRAQCKPIERAEQASENEAHNADHPRSAWPRFGWGECRMRRVCDEYGALSLFWDKQTAFNSRGLLLSLNVW